MWKRNARDIYRILYERMRHLLDEMMAREGAMASSEEETMTQWAPVLDVYETDQALVIQIEVAGLDTRRLQIEQKQGQLWIRGERHLPKLAEGGTYERIEIPTGVFECTVPLPSSVRGHPPTFRYQDGILEVRIPKEA